MAQFAFTPHGGSLSRVALRQTLIMFHKFPRWTLTLGRHGFGFPFVKGGNYSPFMLLGELQPVRAAQCRAGVDMGKAQGRLAGKC